MSDQGTPLVLPRCSLPLTEPGIYLDASDWSKVAVVPEGGHYEYPQKIKADWPVYANEPSLTGVFYGPLPAVEGEA